MSANVRIRNRRGAAGALLFDLIVGLAIAAIIALSALPAVRAIMAEQQLRGESRHLAETLDDLAQQAKKGETTVTVIILPNGYFARDEASGRVLARHEVPAGMHLALNASRPDRFSFSSGGTAQPAAVTIESAGSGACLLRIALRGRISYEC